MVRYVAEWFNAEDITGFNKDRTEYEYWIVNGVMMGRGGYELFLEALKKEMKYEG